jgi:hypothetical protein
VYYLSRSTKNWALIVGLQPNEYYYVKVMAYNSAGEGPESERFLGKTNLEISESEINLFLTFRAYLQKSASKSTDIGPYLQRGPVDCPSRLALCCSSSGRGTNHWLQGDTIINCCKIKF